MRLLRNLLYRLSIDVAGSIDDLVRLRYRDIKWLIAKGGLENVFKSVHEVNRGWAK